MTGDPGAAERRAFFDAVGGEVFHTASREGTKVTLGTLPAADGTVRVLLWAEVPNVGPVGVHVVLPTDQVAQMGEQLTRAARR